MFGWKEDEGASVSKAEEGTAAEEAKPSSKGTAEGAEQKWWIRLRQDRNFAFKFGLVALLLVVYHIYLGFAIKFSWKRSENFCEGSKFLVFLTVCAYIYLVIDLFLYSFMEKTAIPAIRTKIPPNVAEQYKAFRTSRCFPVLEGSIVGLMMLLFILIDNDKNRRLRMISFVGLIFLLLIGFIFSKHKSKIDWRQVAWGVLLQFIVALLILRWPPVESIFACFDQKVQRLLELTDKGTAFVFGYLVTGEINIGIDSPRTERIFAFRVMPMIIVFAFYVAVLYYFGVMQRILKVLGWAFQFILGTTACESFNAAANIFVGMTEALLVVQPFLKNLTKSELHAVLTAGFATISGPTMAIYMNHGVESKHLVSATAMSATAALAFSKLLYPETDTTKTHIQHVEVKRKDKSIMQAGTNAVIASIPLIASIIANLIIFIVLMEFLDVCVAWFADQIDQRVNFQWVIRKILTPVAFFLGIDWSESSTVAYLLARSVAVNEYDAFMELVRLKNDKARLSDRARQIATHALCSFSNIGSMGIQIGAFGFLVPQRKHEVSQMALRTMLTGLGASLMTACIAGIIIDSSAVPEIIDLSAKEILKTNSTNFMENA